MARSWRSLIGDEVRATSRMKPKPPVVFALRVLSGSGIFHLVAKPEHREALCGQDCAGREASRWMEIVDATVDTDCCPGCAAVAKKMK